MSVLDTLSPLYVGSGLAVGFIVGLTGVGGGSLMTPLLVLLFGVHPATAVGTDLLYAGFTKSVGTAVHHQRGGINWRIVGLLAAGSVPASAATLIGLKLLGINTQAASVAISLSLGFALVLTAVSLVFRDQMTRYVRGAAALAPRTQAILTVVTGFAIGVLVSISSVGAGAVGVTVLYFLYPKQPARTIVGSDIAHAVPLTLIAGSGHWLLGSVNWEVLISLLVGSIPGIVIGSLLVPKVSETFLRYALAMVLTVVGGRLLLA